MTPEELFKVDELQKADDWVCPNCGEMSFIDQDGIERVGKHIWCDQYCGRCDSNWHVDFTITGITHLNIGMSVEDLAIQDKECEADDLGPNDEEGHY